VKLIVGLGNAGPQYKDTRHNVGFEVIECLAERHGIDLGGEKFHAWFGQGKVGSERIGLLKPTTLMNRSGRAVLAAGRFYKIELTDLLVIVDDFALPLGRLRMRESGSAGGHNGLQDIFDTLSSEQWCRLRVGIGDAVGGATAHVLGKFTKRERAFVNKIVQRSADAAECWLTAGPVTAMTRFNGDVPDED